MAKRFIYIILLALIVPDALSQPVKQQPSVYNVKRMPFNVPGFNNISPVIVKDGIIFCSDKRYSGIEDVTGYDGRRLYNIYLAEKKDTSGYRKPHAIKTDRTNKFNNGPLCIAPDGKTVYFTSEVETGKAAENRNYKNHSGIFSAELSGSELISIKPFKYRPAIGEQGWEIPVFCF
jgi:hypothetical protein